MATGRKKINKKELISENGDILDFIASDEPRSDFFQVRWRAFISEIPFVATNRCLAWTRATEGTPMKASLRVIASANAQDRCGLPARVAGPSESDAKWDRRPERGARSRPCQAKQMRMRAPGGSSNGGLMVRSSASYLWPSRNAERLIFGTAHSCSYET